MTKSLDTRLAERAHTRPRAPKTAFGDFALEMRAYLGQLGEWPKTEYQKDPVGFARDILGYTPCRTIEEVEAAIARARKEDPKRPAKILWWKQIEMLEALVPENASVAVRAGQKNSKTKTAAIAALWFFACFPAARVMLTATKMAQIERYIWREILAELRDARVPIAGDVAQKATTGIRGSGLREISGTTATRPEAMQGFSAANMLVIADESSGIADPVFEAIEGNRAGGGRLLMLSNPTRTMGFFFDAFHKRKAIFACIHIRSDETPNTIAGRMLIPGLAGPEWLARQKEGYGENHPFYIVRVLGDFVMLDEQRIVSMQLIAEAIERWAETDEVGRLSVGLDPAGPGAGGDESAFVVRRGQKVLAIYRFSAQTEDALLVQLLGILATHRLPREEEAPRVIVDRSGPIGVRVVAKFRTYLEKNQHAFEVVSVIGSDKSFNAIFRCDRVRDELWWRLGEWIRNGGAIPDDAQLEKELHAPKWYTPPGRDVLKATSKDELRKLLDGRSPDSADALALAVWESSEDTVSAQKQNATTTAARRVARAPDDVPTLDPYAGGLDPYAWQDRFR